MKKNQKYFNSILRLVKFLRIEQTKGNNFEILEMLILLNEAKLSNIR